MALLRFQSVFSSTWEMISLSTRSMATLRMAFNEKVVLSGELLPWRSSRSLRLTELEVAGADALKASYEYLKKLGAE